MVKYLEKYFLFLFVFAFALSIVNVTPTFAKKEGKKDSTDVDAEACKTDVKEDKTKPEEKYSAKCKEQCTSTDEKFAQFKKDNETICKLFPATASDGGTTSTGTITDPNVAKIVENVIAELNKTTETAALDAIVPEFKTQASKYEFTITFDAKLKAALNSILFSTTTTTTTTKLSYNVLNADTATVAPAPTATSGSAAPAASSDKVNNAALAIKSIILGSFDAPATITGKYNEKVIKELRDNWLNIDLKGDVAAATTAFDPTKFKLVVAGIPAYTLPHELYQYGFDAALKKAIDEAKDAASAKSAFLTPYKAYVTNNLKVVTADTWADNKPLEFKVTLNPEAAKIVASIDNLAALSIDGTTTLAKIKESFDFTVTRFTHTDFGTSSPFTDDASFKTGGIEHTGLVPVKINIAPKGVTAPDASKPGLKALYDAKVRDLSKEFGKKLVPLATASTTLGASDITAPATGSLYEEIYKGAIKDLDLTKVNKINTAAAAITKETFAANDIVNAKIIAVKKDTSDILLELGGVTAGHLTGFKKIAGLKVTNTSIKALTGATGADFFAITNLDGPVNAGTTECSAAGDAAKFATLLAVAANAHCKNLLKLELIDPAFADLSAFGIADGGNTGAIAGTTIAASISAILDILEDVKKFTTHFTPGATKAEDNFEASQTIRDILAGSKSVEGFPSANLVTENFSNHNDALTALKGLPAAAGPHTFLLREVGANTVKIVYLTKKITRTS